MRIGQGGTQMYCPKCEKITVCQAIPLSQLDEESEQRWYKTEHEDIQWFRRGRRCQECFEEFITSEINEKYLDELTELRDAVADIKNNAQLYIAESKQTSKALKKLTKSISVLKALNRI